MTGLWAVRLRKVFLPGLESGWHRAALPSEGSGECPGLFQLLEAAHTPGPTAPSSIFKASVLAPPDPLRHTFKPPSASLFAFKDLCTYLGPTRAIQGYLLTPGSAGDNLILLCLQPTTSEGLHIFGDHWSATRLRTGGFQLVPLLEGWRSHSE